MWPTSRSAVTLVIACLISFLDLAAQEERGLRQLTDDPAQDGFPSWSPDGTRIAFVSRRSGNFDIWMVEVDVDEVRRELMKGGVR